jgi:hypothetical protein
MRLCIPVAIACRGLADEIGIEGRNAMSTLAAVEPTVSPGYRHHQRLITPGPHLRLGRGAIKWYEIRRPDAPMPEGLEEETKAFLRTELEAKRLDVEGQPGFVMLHLAGSARGPNTVALLLVSTWRQDNEVWESVYWKFLDGGSYQRVVKGDHSATYCVWELAAVWHERQAWTRYLESARDQAALDAYMADSFSGLV